MSRWTILDYVDETGANPVERWLAHLPMDAQGAIESRLLAMEGLENWPPKWTTKLVAWNGLVEVRITFMKVQYRPLGVFRPGREFVLLCGAIEKGDELPKRLLDTADRRRKHLLREPNRVRPHQY